MESAEQEFMDLMKKYPPVFMGDKPPDLETVQARALMAIILRTHGGVIK